MKKTIYIETTIPSSYYDIRTVPEFAARKQWTRAFWEFEKPDYEVMTRLGVIHELQRGSYPDQAEKIDVSLQSQHFAYF